MVEPRHELNLALEPLEKMFRQQQDVVPAIAQRWNRDRDSRDAMRAFEIVPGRKE